MLFKKGPVQFWRDSSYRHFWDFPEGFPYFTALMYAHLLQFIAT